MISLSSLNSFESCRYPKGVHSFTKNKLLLCRIPFSSSALPLIKSNVLFRIFFSSFFNISHSSILFNFYTHFSAIWFHSKIYSIIPRSFTNKQHFIRNKNCFNCFSNQNYSKILVFLHILVLQKQTTPSIDASWNLIYSSIWMKKFHRELEFF